MHGVAEWDPERLLDRPVVVRVAGDADAGFYRPRPGFGDPAGPSGATLEAYRWGALTGGTATRTFSLVLLLPFMLSNIAVWMLPVAGPPAAAARAICRLLAATITAMYVFSLVGASLDLIAWQCAGYPRCLEGRRWISWIGGMPPGQRLAILSIVPMAAIALIWRLGARTLRLPEDAVATPQGVGANRLDTPEFWDTRNLKQRLRSVHVAVALGTLNAPLLVPLARHDGRFPGYALLAADAALLLAALVLLCLPAFERRGEGRRASVTLRWAAVVLTALNLAYALAPRPPWRAAGTLPGFEQLLGGLFIGQLVLIVVLVVDVLVLRHRHHPGQTWLLGSGAPVLISVAVGVAVAFSCALNFLMAEYLDRGYSPTLARPLPPGAPPLWPAAAYRWAILGFTVALLVVAVVAAVGGRIQRFRLRRTADEQVRREFPEASRVPPERVRAVRDAIVQAQLADRLGPALLATYAALTLITLASAGRSVKHHLPGTLAGELVGPALADAVIFVTDLGTLLIVLFAVGLAGGALVASRSGGLRLVGVLWEVANFWPRAAHPLAPPSYSERAVPELTRRIKRLTAEGNAIVLSGQSHGSVLAAATVLTLPTSCQERVALLTYASPLARLYGQLFPAYVNTEALREVGDRLDWRWINLWRDTDPIGGPVFALDRLPPNDPAAGVDRHDRDPKGLEIPPTDTVPPPIEGHRFTPDEDFHTAVRELVDLLNRRNSPPGGSP